MTESDSKISPKPPEIIENIYWLLLYGKRYWKLILISLLFFLFTYLVTNYNYDLISTIKSYLNNTNTIGDLLGRE